MVTRSDRAVPLGGWLGYFATSGKILAKDAGIAAEFAARLGQDATFASAAHTAFRRLVDAGYGEMDDAVICKIMAGWDRE